MSSIGGVVTVDLAGDDDADGRSLGDHRANLHRAGVGAHEEAVAAGLCALMRDEEGVLGVAGRMVGGEVEGFEVVEVGLDLRAEIGAVAEVVEDLHDLVHGLEEGVGDAWRANGSGEGDVNSPFC